ncbi:PAS domain S-box protein [Sphaerospermopsis aphanizomenoides BCCUSP55]|uniref:PAS domain S-box protein n=1 Tax=Sphaerospermopsis aphanizomenoides TaxID=459663 RepID=UPI001903876F|nr:PAS domain S-box protein [Sphaerospermopsis aphanizomenoides]MBK1987202.1 PAS domain S-box protein [Sphaerospermopsis aphanizomenoides BCCUSP55]
MDTKSFSSSDIEKTILNTPLTLPGSTPVIEAIRLMSQVRETCHLTLALVQSDANLINSVEQASCVLVVQNKKLIGIFTERDIVRSTALGLNLEQATLAEVMIQNPVTIKKSKFTNIFVVLNLFRQYKTRHLVVVDEQDDLIGLVTPATVRQLLQAADLLKIRTIGEVMTSQVIKAPSTTSVLELARLMAEYSVSCVVITESDSQVIGIVTERDIVQIRSLSLDILEIQAHIVMSTPLFSMSPQQSLWEAHQQMQQRHIRRLVVVSDRNELLGIVTQTNILYSLDPLAMYETVNLLQEKIDQLEAEKVEILQKQNTELEIQIQERTKQLKQQTNSDRLLANLSQKVQKSKDIEFILQTTVSEIREYLKTDRVIIYQFKSLVSGKIVAESLLPHITSILGRVIDDSCFAERWLEPYLNGRVRRIEDIYTSGLTDCHIQLLETANIRANLIVPIIYHHQLWGLLCAHQCHKPRYWESAEAELLEKVSTQIVIAIQQSQLYQEAQKELLERQQAEIILKKLNEELENRVAERTAELQQINQDLLLEINERQRVEQKLQNQLATIESTIDGIAILHNDKYLYLNKAHLEIFGYNSAEQLIGKSWRELYYPEELVRFESEVFPILSQAGYWRGEATARRRDGSIFNEEVSLTLTKDGELICVCRDITESKQAEAKLQKLLHELSDFKYALDQSAIVAITDPQGNITYANDNFCEISQYSKAELIGSNHRILNSGYHSQEYFQNLWSTITKGQVWRGEIKNRAKDGTDYWVDSTIVPFLDHSGTPWQYLSIRKDITDRKQAESALQESEQKFRQLAENLHQVFWITDPEQSEILYISPAYEEIWGRSCESLYENPISFVESVHPKDREKLINAVANKKYGFDIEYRIIRPDGSMRWIRDQAFPIQDETGAVVRVVGIAEDITKSKEAAVALEQSQHFLRQVIDTNPNLIFVKDGEGRFILANQAFAEIYGTTVEELIGKTEADFNPNLDEVAYYQSINQQVMTTLQSHTIPERMIITATGATRYFQFIKSPLIAADGKAYHTLGVSTDITERKRAEQEIHKALEREKELGELKSRFVSMTSHEFRTPLAVISSSVGILKDFGHKLDDARKEKHLDCIQTYVKHTTQLLDDILLINKAENGKLAFEPAPLDLITFFHKLSEEIQLSAPNHTIVFSSNSQVSVIGNLDKKLLRQIVINLLSNAIKYSPHSATINFDLNITESNVIFSIQDQGIGIPEADIDQLFESFHRARNVGNIHGTGLGLSIVAKCIDLHKGSITVNSDEGVGTTFIVTIPLQSVIFLPDIANNTDR